MRIWGVVTSYVGSERAVENARGACRELSRRRVEREEVALFLETERREGVRDANIG